MTDVPTHMYEAKMTVTLYTHAEPTSDVEAKVRDALGMADIGCSLGSVKIESVEDVLYKGEDMDA